MRDFWSICLFSFSVNLSYLGVEAGTKYVKQEPSALGWMKICTGLPRMVPVYTWYPSIMNSTVFHPRKCDSKLYVTSGLDHKHVMLRITLRAIKARISHLDELLSHSDEERVSQ